MVVGGHGELQTRRGGRDRRDRTALVVVAALNLVLDFDFIETGVERGAPKHMEWYGAFGLLVTLVWLCHGGIHQRRWILYQIFREPTPLRLTIVPAGVPHWFTDIQGSITQMALHLPIIPPAK